MPWRGTDSPSKDTERDADRDLVQDTGLDSLQDADRDSEQDANRDSVQDADRDSIQDTDRDPEPLPKNDPEPLSNPDPDLESKMTKLADAIPKRRERRKSVVFVPGRVVSTYEHIKIEETEVAAEIFIPPDGGWGWVVLVCSFSCTMLLNGTGHTFGPLLPDICVDLTLGEAAVASVNSLQISISMIVSPVAAALINKFGFRVCTMAGAMICSISLFITYFVNDYWGLLMFYGIYTGLGSSLINMSASLVVGFYFEKFRAITSAIATCGSSLGTAILFPVNVMIVKSAGWRTTLLFHSGLVGLIFFFGMSFRPLIPWTVTTTDMDEDKPIRTATILPKFSPVSLKKTVSNIVQRGGALTRSERIFKSASSYYFPTAAEVIQEETIPVTARRKSVAWDQPGPSKENSADDETELLTLAKSKITLTAPQAISERQLKQVKSSAQLQDRPTLNIEINAEIKRPKNRKCCKCCSWEPHVTRARPLYRDDAFYHGKVESLPEYQKSIVNIRPDKRTGFEYQMAVSRTALVSDLTEKQSIFSTAVGRVLATMLDAALLKKVSFLLLCSSGFFSHAGAFVPYVYLLDRNQKAGIDEGHCSAFISVLSFANILGRLTLSTLTSKIGVLKIFAASIIIAGTSTIISTCSYNIFYQYGYSILFGFFISVLSALRSVLLVSLYGLEKLTNATGIFLIFVGLGLVIGTPMAGVFKNAYGYDVVFYVSGFLITLGGIFAIPIIVVVRREKEREELSKWQSSKTLLFQD